jgi:hypothetical protein
MFVFYRYANIRSDETYGVPNTASAKDYCALQEVNIHLHVLLRDTALDILTLFEHWGCQLKVRAIAVKVVPPVYPIKELVRSEHLNFVLPHHCLTDCTTENEAAALGASCEMQK